MEKKVAKVCKKIVRNSMTINSDGISTFFCYQPKMPTELKKVKKNDK